jgi:hypothetical protein
MSATRYARSPIDLAATLGPLSGWLKMKNPASLSDFFMGRPSRQEWRPMYDHLPIHRSSGSELIPYRIEVCV